MLQATKRVGQMIIRLYKVKDKGSTSVSNATDPDNIIQNTGYYFDYESNKAAYDAMVTPQDVHSFFDMEY